MRAVNFREYVLNPIAYKIGLNPATDFNKPEAKAISTYINGFVRKAWVALDWPEWSVTQVAVVSNTHIVPYTIVVELPGGSINVIEIGKVLAVYLTDPNLSDVPSDTPFTEMDTGIHVGYDHGAYVWIKHLPQCPQYTTDEWDSNRSYTKGDVIYLPDQGECYRSLTYFNINHNPKPPDPFGILNREDQPFTPGTEGTVQQLGVWNMFMVPPLSVNPVDPPVTGTEYTMNIFDEDGVLITSQSATGNGVKTLATLLGELLTAFQADALVSTFAFTSDDASLVLRAANASVFSGNTVINGGGFVDKRIAGKQLAAYIPAAGGIPPQPQRTVVTVTSDLVVPGTEFTLELIDNFGQRHTASYTAVPDDGILDVLAGLSSAIAARGVGDSVMASVVALVDTASGTLTIETPIPSGVNVTTKPGGPVWWEIEPFPIELVDGAIRNANADVLKEWGQYQIGLAEEQLVPQEVAAHARVGREQRTDEPTERGRRRSRYAIN